MLIKKIQTQKYLIMFNLKTGTEILSGINGYQDPFILENPNMIDIGIMGHCFHKCPMCYQGNKTQPNMTIEDYKNLISSVKDHVNQVALGGRGDPNHHEHFKEIMKYTRDNHIAPNYTTSGIGLTKEMIDITKEYTGAVAVSEYQKDFTYSAIDSFIDAGIKTNIHVIFSSKSADRCIDMIEGKDVWEGKVNIDKLNAVVFLLFKPQGRGKDLPDWIPSAEQIERFSNIIKDPKCKFKIGMDSCMCNKLKQIGRQFTPIEEMMLDSCEAGRMSSYVSPDMKFMPCSFCNHDQDGISLKEKSLQEIWRSGHSFLEVRNKLTKNPHQCPYEL